MRDKSIPRRKKNIVVIGGGTGTFAVLTGLKDYPVNLTAIVSMADDGGSTGRLRDEFGVLPPGDIRQCLVALSESSDVMRTLFTHRYDRGGLAGHTFGNIFISTLEQVAGSFDTALDMLHDILAIKGRVVPVTLEKIHLNAELKNGKQLNGESAFMGYQLVSMYGIKKIWLQPPGKINPKALKAIRSADLIVVGPGKLYTSILPNFLVEGMKKAFIEANAKKIYISNLMSQQGHTDHFSVSDYVKTLESYIKPGVFDEIIFNTKSPPAQLLRRYADEGEPVLCGIKCRALGKKLFGTNLLAGGVAKTPKKDFLRRTLIRHDAKKLAKAIMGTFKR